jgi:hypothetical protein
MTRLIYHPIEGPADSVSPIDATVIDMVSSKPIKLTCPYLGRIPLKRIVDKCAAWQLVTDVEELLRSQGISDRKWFVDFLISNASNVRHCKKLHAKVVLTGQQALVGSANFTLSGLCQRTEMSVLLSDQTAINELDTWFDDLWKRCSQIEVEAITDFAASLPERSPTETESKSFSLPMGPQVDLAFAKADRSKEPQSLFLGLLADANRLLAFDVETGTLPCRHDQLLLSFAGISNGLFQPSDVSEAWHQQHEDDFEADYTLRFVVDGRYYEGRLRNHGDWYDVERLVAIANRALADSRHGERFLPLYSGGQVAFFTFGVPERFEQLATAIALPLENDPDRAMKEGKEFERQVLEKYGGSGAVVK